MLTRPHRVRILTHCLNKLYPRCVKRKNLFAYKDAQDLAEEIGERIWICLLRYRNKPYDEAVKLAMTTGKNALTSMVRSRLTVVKRGAKAKQVFKDPSDSESMYWLSSHHIYANGVKIIDTMEALISVAIQQVGVKRSRFLVKALLYDWKRGTDPRKEQIEIMTVFKTNRVGVIRKMINSFSHRVDYVLKDSGYNAYDNMLEKKEGRWKVSKDLD